jgi:transposase
VDVRSGTIRQVIEGIIFRLRVGLPWRDLPEQFGPWQTVWKRHKRFSTDGTWDKILAQLQAEADAAGDIDWIVSVDSTIARVHQHGATAKRSVSSDSSLTGGGTELQETA